MVNPFAPLRRNLRSHGGLSICHHIHDLPAQAPLVKLQRGVTLTVKRQVWVDFHILIIEAEFTPCCPPCPTDCA